MLLLAQLNLHRPRLKPPNPQTANPQLKYHPPPPRPPNLYWLQPLRRRRRYQKPKKFQRRPPKRRMNQRQQRIRAQKRILTKILLMKNSAGLKKWLLRERLKPLSGVRRHTKLPLLRVAKMTFAVPFVVFLGMSIPERRNSWTRSVLFPT